MLRDETLSGTDDVAVDERLAAVRDSVLLEAVKDGEFVAESVATSMLRLDSPDCNTVLMQDTDC
jgi:hypothetical protein